MIGPCINTSRGRYFDYLSPGLHEFDIVEIAHALSRICRYTGHVGNCDDPADDDLIYTVAQHSVLVSNLLQGSGLELDGLLHDASEAYTNDVNSPLKSLLPAYKELEISVEIPLLLSFGIKYPLSPMVKVADRFAMDCERMTFMRGVAKPHAHGWWPLSPWAKPLDRVWGVAESKRNFLARYKELVK